MDQWAGPGGVVIGKERKSEYIVLIGLEGGPKGWGIQWMIRSRELKALEIAL